MNESAMERLLLSAVTENPEWALQRLVYLENFITKEIIK
jgi:hypothetical protein